VTVYYVVLVVIAFERLAELVVSQRHAADSLSHGGVDRAGGISR
jgi:isoprenylcysteine carboxyl methyltransferase (ICMT) family protein YpbQ